MGKPFLPNLDIVQQMYKNKPNQLKDNIKKVLRIADEQVAVNKGKWTGLEGIIDMSSSELERLIYYKGNLALFYFEDIDQFYILPYVMQGGLDLYGRMTTITPVPIASDSTDEKSAAFIAKRNYLASLKFRVAYSIKSDMEVAKVGFGGWAVLLRDRTPQFGSCSNGELSRQALNEAIIDFEATLYPYARTALRNSTGIKGLLVNNSDDASTVYDTNKGLENAALNGDQFIPITAKSTAEELTNGTSVRAEDFLLVMQSVDNLRLSTHGLGDGAILEKKSHMLQSELTCNASPVSLIQQDMINARQHFCLIANSIWGTSLWYEPSEDLTGMDINNDGVNYDRNVESNNMEESENDAD